MRFWKLILLMLLIAVSTDGTAKKKRSVRVKIGNTTNMERMDETVEIQTADIAKLLNAKKNLSWVVRKESGEEIPSQLTYDDKLIFQVKLAANETVEYVIEQGQPLPTDTLVGGAFYPQRKDDLAWESDKAAYRAYGPALQRTGEKAYGYDAWTKSTDKRVVAKRYYDNAHGKSFHKDHGEGMDVYGVGATLGACTSALFPEGNILYPYCFKEYEILDNGPIRFTARLTYHPLEVEQANNVVETRIISIDKGSWLNRTAVSYEGLEKPMPVVTGIVLHEENPYGYCCSPEKGYMLYADLTQNANAGNGVIYVGAVFPNKVTGMMPQFFPKNEWKQRSAVGHILSESLYQPNEKYVYYWGASWSKGGCPSAMVWEDYLTLFSEQLQTPLVVELQY